jgi:CheY-like chemotaxis protein
VNPRCRSEHRCAIQGHSRGCRGQTIGGLSNTRYKTSMPRELMPESTAGRPIEPAPGDRTGRASAARPTSYVLVVDDEVVVREFLTRCLERSGYAVKQAANAAEALETMMVEPAAAVLCDVRMPGQDGLWLAARLRARWPDTAVVMASAIDDIETVRQSRELGALDYITKPIKTDQLLQVLRRVTVAPREGTMSEDSSSAPVEYPPATETKIEAEYTLETPVRCPACGERIATLKAVRLIRAQVNFTSTLPRRGRVMACPHCLAVIPAELSNF